MAVATATNVTLRTLEGTVQRTLEVANVTVLRYSPDGKQMVLMSNDGNNRLTFMKPHKA